MATPRLSDELANQAIKAREKYGSIQGAAKALGVSRQTLQSRLRVAEARGQLPDQEIIFPDLPSSELPPEQLIEQACKRFEGHLAARDARRWMEIKVKSNKPIGVCFMGDPHIDNNGCNWPLLRRDIKILEDTPGLYAVNIGDLTDNWVGRLVRLYADQEMSKKQAWKLAKYLLKDCGINGSATSSAITTHGMTARISSRPTPSRWSRSRTGSRDSRSHFPTASGCEFTPRTTSPARPSGTRCTARRRRR
jgi:hypothetical protein